MVNVETEFLGKVFSSPLVLASGVCGYGEEMEKFINLKYVGGITTKTITPYPHEGNPPPRIKEIPGGIINSIGLANVGVEKFLQEKLPLLLSLPLRKIVSIGGFKEEDFFLLAERLSEVKEIDFLEVNLSCPNIRKDILFAQDSKVSFQIIEGVKRVTPHPIIIKLSPLVNDIREIVSACIEAGADALNISNTIPVLVLDEEESKPLLGGIFGGLSGPCLKPVSLRWIYLTKKKFSIPIIGTGGVYSGKDALDYLVCGADLVSLGSVLLLEPSAPRRIYGELINEMRKRKIKSIKNIKNQFRL